MKSNWKNRISIIIPVAVLIVFSLAAAALYRKIMDDEQPAAEISTVIYGQDGKKDGMQLDSEPIRISEEYVYFQDRIVKRFYFEDEEIDEYTAVVGNIFSYFPDAIEKTFMLVPSRIVFEDIEGIDDKENFLKTYEEINVHLGGKANVLDMYDVLFGHTDEYVYFRTDEVWTALGAYYAAQNYLERNGIEIYPIENYKENKFVDYVGTMWAADGAEYIFNSPDYVSYYTLNGMKNEQTIMAYQNNVYSEFESPVIAVSRMGTDIFMGAVFSHSVIEGDGGNSKSLMIIGDKNAKLFAPWLIPYYEKICVIDPAYFAGGHDEFDYLIENNGITEVLLLTSMNTLDNDVRMDRIGHLTELPALPELDETEDE